MADPSSYRPEPAAIPLGPGVYRFRDPDGVVIYVGKAKSLRQRLSSYFADLASLHPRTQAMVLAAASVDWVTVASEVEALQLEFTWIKEFDPRFNVRYRDDKSYPYLAVTVGEEFPRALVTRDAKRKGVRYFGPYAHAWAIRETLDLLLRVFPLRTCSAGVFRRAGQVGRPCLLGYIDRCSAPCVGRVSAAEHRVIVEEFCSFMAGQTRAVERRLRTEMTQAAAAMDYERAARLRDDLRALERAMERNAVVLGDGTDADVIGVAEDDLEASVEVFHVRDGRVRGQRAFVVEKVEEIDTPALVTRLLDRLYADSDAVPREVLVPVEPDPAAVAWLESRRGGRVDVRVPRRGDKRALLETVTRNAEQSLVLHKSRRAGDLTARSRALQEVQDMLGLAEAPLRIECIDVSHLGGEDVVGSLVVFEDGLPRRSDYRSYTLSEAGSRDDTAAIHEVVTRRFRRSADDEAPGATDAQAAEAAPSAPATRRFAYRPQLLLVDGGAPQVAAAAAALGALGVEGIAIAGLAKRLEEVWLPGDPDPVILPRSSDGLYLLQRVRDEAHRSALRHQRSRRRRTVKASALDAIPGLGEARKRDLLRAFGSVRRIRAASEDELQAVPGIGPALAVAIRTGLAAQPETVAVNTATGEIVSASDEA